MDLLKLNGKTALVTGGSRGIGAQIVKDLASAGAKVAFVASTEENAKKAQDSFLKDNIKTTALWADMSQSESAKEVVEKTIKEFGRLDILVNNAGITDNCLMLRMTNELWQKVIDTNLSAVFYTSKAVLRQMMKQRYGKIINISSVVGFTGNAGQASYAASKAALVGFTKSLAKEVASRNISCNIVAPGYIQTDMTKDLPEAGHDFLLKNIAAGKMGEPKDVSNCVLFLSSPMSDYVNGSTIHVNGGLY